MSTEPGRNDAYLWAMLIDPLCKVGHGGAQAERLARIFIAVIRRDAGLTDTWAPGDAIPDAVSEVTDLDGAAWKRLAKGPNAGLWRMRGFSRARHTPSSGEPHTTEALLTEWGPCTALSSPPRQEG